MTRQTWGDFRGARGDDVAAPMKEGRLKELCRDVFSDPKGEELLDLLIETYVFRSWDWGVSERALRDFEGFRKCVLTFRMLARKPNVANSVDPGRKSSRRPASGADAD